MHLSRLIFRIGFNYQTFASRRFIVSSEAVGNNPTLRDFTKFPGRATEDKALPSLMR